MSDALTGGRPAGVAVYCYEGPEYILRLRGVDRARGYQVTLDEPPNLPGVRPRAGHRPGRAHAQALPKESHRQAALALNPGGGRRDLRQSLPAGNGHHGVHAAAATGDAAPGIHHYALCGCRRGGEEVLLGGGPWLCLRGGSPTCAVAWWRALVDQVPGSRGRVALGTRSEGSDRPVDCLACQDPRG